MEKFRGCICASPMIPVSLSRARARDFNLQQALAGVPMANQRGTVRAFIHREDPLPFSAAAAARIMNNSKVICFSGYNRLN